jgi:type IV pilus assembly protein PilW
MKTLMHTKAKQSGFSLVEIMVGLVIGLLTTLAITQVVTAFEGQKRSTTGGSEAQVNGSVALFTIQSDLQMAGYGLPVYDAEKSSLKCTNNPTIDHDADAGSAPIGLFPIVLNDGGAGESDTVRIRFGDTINAGAVSTVFNVAGLELGVESNMGCSDKDTIMVSKGATCNLTQVDDGNLDTDTTHITLKSNVGAASNDGISCLGKWSEYVYQVTDNQLTKAGEIDATTDLPSAIAVPIMADIVNIQAQYGVSNAVADNEIASWEDPVGAWANPSVTDRNRIKAIRIAVVARNGQLEKENVTFTCTTNQGTQNNGPCAWDDTNLPNPAPEIDLSNEPNWQRYRYRVYETIVPLRNMVWARKALES